MLDVHEDIQTAISRPLSQDDESELEQELAELMKADENDENIGGGSPSTSKMDELEAKLAELDLDSLPQVPSGDVSLQEASKN